jgi:ribosomal protein S18 acetylase RimI-like enzyme
MKDIRLRVATPPDAGAVAAVHRESRASYYGPAAADGRDDGRDAMWAVLLGQTARATYVAEHANHVVGFLSMTRAGPCPGSLELTALYVLPVFFGTGAGTLLYTRFEEARRPAEPGRLEVWAANERAIAFYRHRGWVETEIARPGPQGHPFVTWVLPAGR